MPLVAAAECGRFIQFSSTLFVLTFATQETDPQRKEKLKFSRMKLRAGPGGVPSNLVTEE